MHEFDQRKIDLSPIIQEELDKYRLGLKIEPDLAADYWRWKIVNPATSSEVASFTLDAVHVADLAKKGQFDDFMRSRLTNALRVAELI